MKSFITTGPGVGCSFYGLMAVRCGAFCVLSGLLYYLCVKWILSSIAITLLGFRDMFALLFYGLWLGRLAG